MELVYLWVKNYKNLGNIDFNFSSKYTFLYQNDAIKFGKNSENDENFFGENLKITGIVGKNGSGKSSLIKLFEELFFYIGREENTFNQSIENIILIYEIENILYCYSDIKKLKINPPLSKSNKPNFEFISYIAENPYPANFREKFHILNTEDMRSVDLKTVTFDTKFIVFATLKLLDILRILDKNKSTSYMYLPEKIIIKEIDSDLLYESIEVKISDEILLQPFHTFFSSLIEEDVKIECCFKFDDILTARLEAEFIRYIHKQYADYDEDMEILDNNVDEVSFDDIDNDANEVSFDNVDHYEFLTHIYKFHIQNIESMEKNIDKFYTLLKQKEFSISKTNKKLQNMFLKRYIDYIDYDFVDKNGQEFHNLSHGQKSIYGQMINLLYKLDMSAERNFLFFLDEPDLSLHPKWQQKFLSDFITTFTSSISGNNKRQQKIHLIFTTHSPFLISDLARKNIVFLDTDEKGKSKIAYGLENKDETFGANILTLLSDGFFMEDFMGEFAKRKIQNAINFLNNADSNITSKEEVWSIIKIIGEPFLQSSLTTMYKNKYKLSDEEINNEIDMQIAQLQARKIWKET
ncbi:MAG: AAA family ATPase [Campylobacterales bacterium]|nr:AAA family ATPase [Campylobacterales bacterium]